MSGDQTAPTLDLSAGVTPPLSSAPMIVFCPRCGAEYPEITVALTGTQQVQCRDCGLAVTEEPAMLAPDDDEVAFVLDEWPVTHRGEATAILVENGIPYRWEAGMALVVPGEVEEQVDALLDEAENVADEGDFDDEEDEDGDEGADEGFEGEVLEGEIVDAADDGEEDEGDEDGGEEAAEAMSDLYLVADRFQHQPWDVPLAADLTKLSTHIATLLPPYGIDRKTWSRLGDLAAAVVTAVEAGAEDDVVAAETRALREFVREYV